VISPSQFGPASFSASYMVEIHPDQMPCIAAEGIAAGTAAVGAAESVAAGTASG